MQQSAFDQMALQLAGKRLSHIWRGHGSYLYLEFGKLTPDGFRRDGTPKTPKGEFGIALGAEWRICGRRMILCGSSSDERVCARIFPLLQNQSVASIDAQGLLPEISVTFGNGISCSSFSLFEGQPDWAVFDQAGARPVTFFSRQTKVETE